MSRGIWNFLCRLGLQWDTCDGLREFDPKARGAGVLGECASCEHRRPANNETWLAEAEHSRKPDRRQRH